MAEALRDTEYIERIKDTNAAFFANESFGSASPVVKMWQQCYRGTSASQQEIWDFMQANPRGGFGGDNGVESWTVELALAYFGLAGAYQAVYDVNGTCNGGRNCQQQALADIKAFVETQGGPPAVQIYGDKYALVAAVGASKNCNLFRCQPSFDWFRIHIPFQTAYVYKTTDGMLNDFRSSGGSVSIAYFRSPSDRLAVRNEDWQEFDETSSTYYGDPDPPAPGCWVPECEGGGEDPPPMEDLMTVPGAGWDGNAVAVANPGSRNDVIADFVAGLKRTRLDRQPGLEPLALEDGRIAVAEIVWIRSLSDRPDYFLLSFVDTATKQPYAKATVTAQGLLGAITLGGTRPRPPVPSGAEAQRLLAETYGRNVSGNIERAFGHGTVFTTEFEPLYLAREASGTSLLVTPAGRAYAMAAEDSPATSPNPGGRLHGRNGVVFGLTELRRR